MKDGYLEYGTENLLQEDEEEDLEQWIETSHGSWIYQEMTI